MRMSGLRSPFSSSMPTHVHTTAPSPRPAQVNSFDSQAPYVIGKGAAQWAVHSMQGTVNSSGGGCMRGRMEERLHASGLEEAVTAPDA